MGNTKAVGIDFKGECRGIILISEDSSATFINDLDMYYNFLVKAGLNSDNDDINLHIVNDVLGYIIALVFDNLISLNGVIKFDDFLTDLEQVYINKNHDYGNSFGESFKEFGIISAIVRISDKVKRIKALYNNLQGAKVKTESLSDTASDLICYCIMTKHELNSNKLN